MHYSCLGRDKEKKKQCVESGIKTSGVLLSKSLIASRQKREIKRNEAPGRLAVKIREITRVLGAASGRYRILYMCMYVCRGASSRSRFRIYWNGRTFRVIGYNYSPTASGRGLVVCLGELTLAGNALGVMHSNWPTDRAVYWPIELRAPAWLAEVSDIVSRERFGPPLMRVRTDRMNTRG